VQPAVVSIRWASEEAELREALALREEVFCREQGVPREEEIDGRDGVAKHLVALEAASGRVVGTLRLLGDGQTAKVGRVAVERPLRRRSVASRMLELAIATARKQGFDRVLLTAQTRATAVYERAGFTIESEPFMEAGIEHVLMGLQLRSTE
jgi:putative N-acetyltransferase (TIGR04045 family)